MPGGIDGIDGKFMPGGLDGCDSGDGISSSSVSQMSAQRSEASPATEPPELAGELPIAVLWVGVPQSVDVKLPKSEDLKAELYSKHMSVYAR
jgi:hypothetical protein